MNKKLTIADLVDGLCRRTKLTPEEAAPFVQEMLQVIVEALATDKLVKVRGLGTFKLLSVDDRESMNVNTGERIIIPGHDKMTFTPDTIMRDEVNKPFADFESVELNDDTPLEAMLDMGEKDSSVATDDEPVDKQEEVPVTEELQPAAEEKPQPVVDELPQPVAEEEVQPASEEELQPASEEELQPASEEELPEEGTTASIMTTEPEKVALVQSAPIETPDMAGTQPEQPEQETVASSSVQNEPNPTPGEPSNTPDTPKRKYWPWVVLGLLVALLLGYLGGSKCSNQPSADPVETPQKAVLTDEAQPSDQPQAPTAEPVDDSQQWPQVEGGEFLIVGEIGKDTMKVGKNLLRISKRHYGSDKYVEYICVMNGITNPDIVPLNMELKLPKLKKKQD